MAYIFIEKAGKFGHKAVEDATNRDALSHLNHCYNVIEISTEDFTKFINLDHTPITNADGTAITGWSTSEGPRKIDGDLDIIRNHSEAQNHYDEYIKCLKNVLTNYPNHPKASVVQSVVDNAVDLSTLDYGSGTEADPWKTVPIWRILAENNQPSVSPLQLP